MSAMRISELARRSGVPASTLRYYGQAGLLPAGRTAAGYREYGTDAVGRLRFIGAGKRLGLPLAEIAELLQVRETGSCAALKSGLRSRVSGRLYQAGEQAAGLRDFTAFLRGVLQRLDDLPDRTGSCGPGCESVTADSVSPAVGRDTARRDTAGRDAAIACSLTRDGQAGRAAAWRAATRDAVRAPVPGGLRLTVPASRAAGIAGLAVAEQECCPFFDFRLHLDGGALHLEIRAPDAASGLVDDLFAAA
jgi:DNA-binding transcriptional MerR regulator